MIDWNRLPVDIINIIINYTNVIVYRNGKYLNRILQDDPRYNIIKKINQPIWFSPNRWTFYYRIFDIYEKRYFAMDYSYNPINNNHYLSKRNMEKYKDGSIRTKEFTDYIFDPDGKCREITEYLLELKIKSSELVNKTI
jgi:hypothetical protein